MLHSLLRSSSKLIPDFLCLRGCSCIFILKLYFLNYHLQVQIRWDLSNRILVNLSREILKIDILFIMNAIIKKYFNNG